MAEAGEVEFRVVVRRDIYEVLAAYCEETPLERCAGQLIEAVLDGRLFRLYKFFDDLIAAIQESKKKVASELKEVAGHEARG